MAQSVLSRKTGVIIGDDVLNLFKYAQEKKFAIPAIVSVHVSMCRETSDAKSIQNVTSSSTVVASLEAARDKKSPVILQMSQGGAAYFAGKVEIYTGITQVCHSLTTLGRSKRQSGSFHRWSCSRSPLHSLGRSSLRHTCRTSYRSLCEEAPAMARRDDGRR